MFDNPEVFWQRIKEYCNVSKMEQIAIHGPLEKNYRRYTT